MSGKLRYVLDTNAVVSLLNGNRELAVRLEAAAYVGISVVTYLEFLAFDGLTLNDRKSFKRFCSRIEIVSLVHNDELADSALTLRTQHRLKLPDAIIGATALCRKAVIITNDSHFSGIPSLTVQSC
ncbi:type II toxin-antitoxin system VapC family toxin [Geobacter sp. FeAm09]|uniref:type II toxin-antitoxin system VapC family toxin n=1 Tax=Geobacter sp. FeAm09 TaxID=2597769 RepID=UPI0011EF15CA|nr:type II toxin-antitoxin system VapC family toxin [Geobacter sp. FeAm09]QEM69815.1 type II toxin-antitoxin system VapC family toxin [Geobacter sp. FeAm09]